MDDPSNAIARVAERLGTGHVSPSAYDTAWVARVPSIEDAGRPAYPLAVEWIRRRQLPTGEWDHVPARPWIHGTVLSTLAAVVALAEWRAPQDAPRIERALERLHVLAAALPTARASTSGFEPLLCSLHEEASALGLHVPAELHLPYVERAKKGLFYVEHLIREEAFLETPHPAWFNLEMCRPLMSKDRVLSAVSMLGDNGSVAASPSASAYLLREHRRLNRDLPAVAAYLQRMVDQGEGGVRHFGDLDHMELVFGLNYLVRGGVPAHSPLLAPAVDLLAARFDLSRGIGWGRCFPSPDSDDTAIGAEILRLAGRPSSIDPVGRYFNGSYFTCYPEETTPTPAVAMNVVAAMQAFDELSPALGEMKQKTVSWLESQIREDGSITDRWHLSPFYPAFRAVAALRDLAPSLGRRCVQWIVREQHESGGWGMLGLPTPEETAYAVLALHGWRERYPVEVDASVMLRASALLEQDHGPPLPMWPCSKALYIPFHMIEAAVLSARHALRAL